MGNWEIRFFPKRYQGSPDCGSVAGCLSSPIEVRNARHQQENAQARGWGNASETRGTVSMADLTRMDRSEGHGGPIGASRAGISRSERGNGGEEGAVELQTREEETRTRVQERKAQ